MFVLLCVALVAAAQANPVGKVIPVFEDIESFRLHTDPRLIYRTLCHDDCHHHILSKPLFAVRIAQGSHSIHFAPLGLNGLAKSPLTTPLHETLISAEPHVITIFPFARFPFELFPGLVDADLVVPEHVTRLSHFYKEAPIVVIFPEEEFMKFNEHQKLIKVAEFSADPSGIMVAKDHALLNRNAALSHLFAPIPATHDVTHAPQPAIFAKGTLYPITNTIPQQNIRIFEEPKKFIPYTRDGNAYFTTVPVY